MIEYLAQYGLFLAKTLTIIAGIVMAAGSVFALAMRQKSVQEPKLEITHLNRQYEDMHKALTSATLSEAGQKARHKADKKRTKAEAKQEKKATKTAESEKKRIFVLDFEGDMQASNVARLREEISAVLIAANEGDEVLVRLESGGGTVHGYGLGASQLQRLRDHGVALTVSVDKVAASGGYMMACVGNTVIAAPFSIIGSIGVLAQFPNFNRLLKRHDIQFEQLYSGEYKRTLTLFGENTEKGRRKVQEELQEMHRLFKEFVQSFRPGLDIEKVSTGEYWLGTRALDLGLVDRLQTSDDFLMTALNEADLVGLRYHKKKTLVEKLGEMMKAKLYRRDDALEQTRPPMLV
ncbi:MAG: protease SohB [Gammaproteobacteria bacterium]|nr:protease SohB [Gammaproteobacteria bacterium]MYJ52763.1 protease SohB [Gammaproteobacteria bacterium]